MKNITLTLVLLVSGFVAYSQASLTENTLMATTGADVLLAKTPVAVSAADCFGEWISPEGYHLTLYNNNKALWKDDGHIYYMTWSSENAAQGDKIKINLLGNNYCKHKVFYLGATESGKEIVEDNTNVHMHATNVFTATLQ